MTKKENRQKCHEARDAFFACVDKATTGEAAECKDLKAVFEKSCPSSWVHHFVIQRQVYKAPPPNGVEEGPSL